MAGLKAVIFDFDGTLIDSAPDITHAANILMRELGAAEFDVLTITGFIGNGIPKLVERIMKARGLDMARHADFTVKFKEIYQADPTSRTIVFDHVRESLAALRATGLKLGLCTNKASSATLLILKNLDLAQYFDAVIGGDSTPHMKPSAEPLIATMQKMGCERDASVYIGDSHVDAEAASAANLRFGLYQGGYCHVDPDTLQANFRFDDYRKLPDLLSNKAYRSAHHP